MAEYIEREAFLDAIERGKKYQQDADDIAEMLQNFPAADVRPVVRGKWVPVGADDQDEGMFMCSECGSEHFFPELLLNIPADNFCPNCGADMGEES